MSDPAFPNPDELQRKLSEFMRSQFGEKVNVQSAFVPAAPADAGNEEPPAEVPVEHDGFEFHYRPRDIKAPPRSLCHPAGRGEKGPQHRGLRPLQPRPLRPCARRRADGRASIEYAKQNVILLGPTGVGKTYLVKHIADLIGVPFVKADATKFSETGYVGGDVEDLVRDLVQKADGDVDARASTASSTSTKSTRSPLATNVSGARRVAGAACRPPC